MKYKCEGKCQKNKTEIFFNYSKGGVRNPICKKCATATAMKNYKDRQANEDLVNIDPFPRPTAI